MRPADFFIYLEAMNNRANEKFKQYAELIRIQTTKLINISGRSLKEGENLTPYECWPFEWDENHTSGDSTPLTNDEIEAHNAKLAAKL